MCVGEAVGLPGIDGQRGSVMVQSGLRILALVTDAFGGHGGIAQYNRDFLSALAGCDRVGDSLTFLQKILTRCINSSPLKKRGFVDATARRKEGERRYLFEVVFV